MAGAQFIKDKYGKFHTYTIDPLKCFCGDDEVISVINLASMLNYELKFSLESIGRKYHPRFAFITPSSSLDIPYR